MRHVVVAQLTVSMIMALGCHKTEAVEATTVSTAGDDKPNDTEPAVVFEGFSTPESVLYDASADVYLVSNINGSPLHDDGNGFISRLKPDGATLALKWIDGSREGVVLNAPKGMAIVGKRLYVTDIHTIRVFDRKSGAPITSIEIAGATFLNDLTPTQDGGVYVSDSGLKAGKQSFEPSGTDAIYAIDAEDSVTTVLKDAALGRPNGLLKRKDGLHVVTFGSGELIHFVGSSRSVVTKLPVGTLDGVVGLGDSTLLVSSWEGASVLRGTAGGTFEVVVSNVDSPADIGLDTKRNRVLIPLFKENRVEAYDLK